MLISQVHGKVTFYFLKMAGLLLIFLCEFVYLDENNYFCIEKYLRD